VRSYHEPSILIQNEAIITVDPSTEDLKLDPAESVIQPIHLSFLYLCWQKTLDLIFGFVSLLLLLVLFPFLAVLIYLNSPGPIFYHQERVGHCGRKFVMHKFRSMRHTPEQAGQLLWTTAGDQRITRIGQFMRTTHMDELPQAINILQGEMTLIGPRPERPEYVAKLEESDPRYHLRLKVKPGLTGWAQVSHGYGNSHWDNLTKLQYDLYYIEHRSFKLDILIIVKTCVAVIRHRGDK